jgi:hypothetical protein
VLKIYGPKRDEITAGWRELLSEELHSLHSSQDSNKMIKSGRMRWSDEKKCIRSVTGKTEETIR